MKLEKAKEILGNLDRQPVISHWHDSRDAIKLGIEALKECKRAREGNPALDGELLPGETPADDSP